LEYVVHWTQKFDQEAHEDYPLHCYDERCEIIASPINSNRFTDFDFKNKKPKKTKIPTFQFVKTGLNAASVTGTRQLRFPLFRGSYESKDTAQG